MAEAVAFAITNDDGKIGDDFIGVNGRDLEIDPGAANSGAPHIDTMNVLGIESMYNYVFISF